MQTPTLTYSNHTESETGTQGTGLPQGKKGVLFSGAPWATEYRQIILSALFMCSCIDLLRVAKHAVSHLETVNLQ